MHIFHFILNRFKIWENIRPPTSKFTSCSKNIWSKREKSEKDLFFKLKKHDSQKLKNFMMKKAEAESTKRIKFLEKKWKIMTRENFK